MTDIYEAGPYTLHSPDSASALTVDGAEWLEDYTPPGPLTSGPDNLIGVPPYHWAQQQIAVRYGLRAESDRPVAFKVKWWWMPTDVLVVTTDGAWRQIPLDQARRT